MRTPAVPRSDAELRAQSPHVFWHLRQVLRLAEHLEWCRREGRDVMHDALDAAALEAFTVSARALVEFFWTPRKLRKDGSERYPADARAVDWFVGAARPWEPGDMPGELRTVGERVGWGVAHVSYHRIDPDGEWGWRHVAIAHHLASSFYDFAQHVPPGRVTGDFEGEVYLEVIGHRGRTHAPAPFKWLSDPPQLVGTPMHPDSIAQLRQGPGAR